jgi:hypothetical protein
MLAYYLQWHMRQSLAPMLFDEPDPTAPTAIPACSKRSGRLFIILMYM